MALDTALFFREFVVSPGGMLHPTLVGLADMMQYRVPQASFVAFVYCSGQHSPMPVLDI